MQGRGPQRKAFDKPYESPGLKFSDRIGREESAFPKAWRVAMETRSRAPHTKELVARPDSPSDEPAHGKAKGARGVSIPPRLPRTFHIGFICAKQHYLEHHRAASESQAPESFNYSPNKPLTIPQNNFFASSVHSSSLSFLTDVSPLYFCLPEFHP